MRRYCSKITVFLLALAVLLSFAACDKKNNGKDDKPADSENERLSGISPDYIPPPFDTDPDGEDRAETGKSDTEKNESDTVKTPDTDESESKTESASDNEKNTEDERESESVKQTEDTKAEEKTEDKEESTESSAPPTELPPNSGTTDSNTDTEEAIELNPDDTPETKPDVHTKTLGFVGGNIAAGGLFAEGDDGYVYYRSESDRWALYRAKPNGKEKSKLSDDIPASINVLGEWVYYVNFADGMKIYRIGTDGEGREKLSDRRVDKLYVAEDRIYYDEIGDSGEKNVYSASHNGTNEKKLIDGMGVYGYYNGKVYCGDTEKLVSYDVNSGKTELIYSGRTHSVSADSSGVYFSAVNEGKFLRFRDGKTEELVKGGDYFNYANGILYYKGYGGAEDDYIAIYALNVESGKKEKILSLSEECYDLDGNKIGLTIAELRDGKLPDDSLKDTNTGAYNIISEDAGYPFIVGEKIYTRGTLRDAVDEKGKWDALILCDYSGGIVWD